MPPVYDDTWFATGYNAWRLAAQDREEKLPNPDEEVLVSDTSGTQHRLEIGALLYVYLDPANKPAQQQTVQALQAGNVRVVDVPGLGLHIHSSALSEAQKRAWATPDDIRRSQAVHAVYRVGLAPNGFIPPPQTAGRIWELKNDGARAQPLEAWALIDHKAPVRKREYAGIGISEGAQT